jgi:hypothetical protein
MYTVNVELDRRIFAETFNGKMEPTLASLFFCVTKVYTLTVGCHVYVILE